MGSNVASAKRRLAENLKRVRDRIEEACARAHRSASDVRLIAVTKEVDIDIIRQTLDAGVLDLGESRAQQLSQRAGMIHESIERRQVLSGGRDRAARPRWHMVGHLQRNKIKLVVPWVELIHSVDSLRLAEDLHHQASRVGRVVDILLQVNTSGERTKFGIAVGAVPHLIEHLREMSGVRLRGLMAMAPIDATEVELRLYFERLRDALGDMRREKLVDSACSELSMGMSQDFETAVECGATMVRLGHALYEGMTTRPLKDHEDRPGLPAGAAHEDAPAGRDDTDE